MSELSADYVDTLIKIRGEFENTKAGRFGNRLLAHVFSTLFPAFFIGHLIYGNPLQWPLTSEQWLLVAAAVVTFGVGLLLHRIINCRFVFDDEGVKALSQSGKLKQVILWNDLTRVDYREIRGIKSFILKTDKDLLQVEFYKSLSEAFARVRSGKS